MLGMPNDSAKPFGSPKAKKKESSRKKVAAPPPALELKEGAVPKPGLRLTRQLGAGAAGEVWEGITDQGNKLALKFIRLQNTAPEMVSNEVRLLTTLRQIQHPHVLTLDDVICLNEMIVLVMELAKGSLWDLYQFSLRETRKHMSARLLVDLLTQAAEGLDFLAAVKLPGLHFGQHGLQHCDVKPSNLLLVGRTVKVADFGLASQQGVYAKSKGMMGTPSYAAPELYSSNSNAGTDQFSLAVTYCYLRTGHFPYEYEQNKPPQGNPELSRVTSREREVLQRALQIRWIDRFPSCKEFMEQLRSAATG
jgi:serine/threonine-protein kinase